MACFSAPKLHSFPWSAGVRYPHLLCPYQPHRTFLVRTNRTAHSTCQHPLPRSSLCPSSHTEFETAKKRTVPTLQELCHGHVPEHIIRRMEELGYFEPTEVQKEALPVLFADCDCVLHAQTGSGKTLAYLLRIFSVVNAQRSTVQALIVVPNRELGIQVTKVARLLAAKSEELYSEKKRCSIMPLLDGGSLKRHRSWLKAEPPTIMIATLGSISQMIERHVLTLNAMRVLVVDEVDFMFNSSKHVSALRKLLTSYSCSKFRQTVFASATIPQHRRFLYEAAQQKWTKADVVHVYVSPVMPLPSCLHHRFVICSQGEKYQALLSLLKSDKPHSAIVFVGVQSEKSKKEGNAPRTISVKEFLESSLMGLCKISLLEEEMNFNRRAASLTELRQGGGYLLVATDIAARGIDLPETTHVYNFDLPNDAVSYLHRAGRTGRKPFSDDTCYATSIITPGEQFVLQRFENELMFSCEQLFLYS